MKKIAFLVLLTATFGASAVAENADVQDLFVSKCAICHGADGSARTTIGKNMKIRDFHSSEVQKQSDADLKAIITKGKGKMPAFEGKLTEAQIDQLLAYIRELPKK
jgi:mono/diheme cytochrome c family protein